MAKNKVTIKDVTDAQSEWAEKIVAENSEGVAALYADGGGSWHRETKSGVDKCELAFNPTLDDSFLTTNEKAFAYFEGTEQKPGFAKKGWTKVIFDPKEHPKAQRFISTTEEGAVALGRYVFEFEDAVLDSAGNQVLASVRLAVDYTFVYKLLDGELKIIAHHSSLPLSQKSIK